MIKATDLKDTGKPGYRIPGSVSLNALAQKLKSLNDEKYGLPIKIYSEQVKSGGFLNASVGDCLIIENTEHPTDYFKYCISVRSQGRMTFIVMNYYGSSVLTGKAHVAEERKQKGSLGGMFMNAISGVNETEYNAEYDYYELIDEMFATLGN